jgi:hypothetical protein
MHLRLYLIAALCLSSIWVLTTAQPRHGELAPAAFALLRHGPHTGTMIHRPTPGAQRCKTCVLSFPTERRFREHWRAVHAHPISSHPTRIIRHPLLNGD